MFQPDPTRSTSPAVPYNPPKEPRCTPRSAEHVQLATDLVRNYYPDIAQTEQDYISERVLQHIDFLRSAYPDITSVRDKVVLDIACGSRSYPDNKDKKYDPWMPRLLLHLGAFPVGVDLHPQLEERFVWHQANLLEYGSLRFLKNASFDAYYICAFPTKKAVEEMVTKGPSWEDVRTDILAHVTRALKPDGRVIRTFTDESEKYVAETSLLFRPSPPPPSGIDWRYFEDCFLD